MVMKYEKATRKAIHSEEVPIVNGEQLVPAAPGADGTLHIDQTIDVEPTMDPDRIDLEAFMKEPIEIQMSDAMDENDPKFAEVTVNGRYIKIPRGEIMRVPRSHVAVLAQAKQMRVIQDKVTNPDGSSGFRERVVMKLTYPFSVLHDPNPKGAAWLRQLLQNPS
jgi:hypothetical protein